VPSIENVYQSEDFQAMHDKMISYFNKQQEESLEKSKSVIDEYSSLLTDIKQTRSSFSQELNANKKSNDGNGKVNVTEILKSHKERSEIERGFFFHTFYEILRQEFMPNQKSIFDRKDGHTVIDTIGRVNSADIKAVLKGRERFETAT
jgi:hypothetical protein